MFCLTAERDKRAEVELALQTTLAELAAFRDKFERQESDLRRVKQASQETSLKLLRHFQQTNVNSSTSLNMSGLWIA